MRRAAKVDGPHAAIVKALRQCGYQVLDPSRVGDGCPDLLVRLGPERREHRERCRRMEAIFVEAKSARGQLREKQQAFRALWPETVTVLNVDETLAVVGMMKLK